MPAGSSAVSALIRTRRVSSPTTTSGRIRYPYARMLVSWNRIQSYKNIFLSHELFLLADRSTRPSDSSIENESFVLTYSQRFSKMPEDGAALPVTGTEKHAKQLGTIAASAADGAGEHHTLEKLAKVLKNKNNLILDFKDNEK